MNKEKKSSFHTKYSIFFLISLYPFKYTFKCTHMCMCAHTPRSLEYTAIFFSSKNAFGLFFFPNQHLWIYFKKISPKIRA